MQETKIRTVGLVLYEGRRDSPAPGEVTVRRLENKEGGEVAVSLLDPAPSLKLYNHSPSGFEWGYLGSGPAQLALALLQDATGDERLALRLHQYFKEDFIAGWGDDWIIEKEQIRRWADLAQQLRFNCAEA